MQGSASSATKSSGPIRARARGTWRRRGCVNLHHRVGHARGRSARSRGRARRPRVVAGAMRSRRRRYGRAGEGAALVGARLPFVEARRRPDAVLGEPP
jgi:hypothetical protein